MGKARLFGVVAPISPITETLDPCEHKRLGIGTFVVFGSAGSLGSRACTCCPSQAMRKINAKSRHSTQFISRRLHACWRKPALQRCVGHRVQHQQPCRSATIYLAWYQPARVTSCKASGSFSATRYFSFFNFPPLLSTRAFINVKSYSLPPPQVRLCVEPGDLLGVAFSSSLATRQALESVA